MGRDVQAARAMGEEICMFGMPFHFRVFRIMLILPPFQGLDPVIGENEEPSEIGAHRWTGRNPGSGPNFHYYGQHDVAVPGLETGNEGHDHNLLNHLVHRFENLPHCFHLEWPPGVSPPDSIVNWIVRQTTGHPYAVDQYRPSALGNVRLTDCHCDLSGGSGSRDPSHVAYQEACSKRFKALVSLFDEAQDPNTVDKLSWGFEDLTRSALLEHCRLDTGLLSLCRTVLNSRRLFRACGLILSLGSKERQICCMV